jgi:hypothetical protein
MGSTHDHQTQDTIGIWGPTDTTSGWNFDYMKRLRVAAVDAITEAVGRLKPAKMSIAAVATQEPDGDMSPYVGDSRDPVVIDPMMHIMQFDEADTGKPIVTVANWGSHPDSLGSNRHYVSSDWVHYFRESLEAGTGSDVVFVQGQCGGQVGPSGMVMPFDEDGTTRLPHDQSYKFIAAWGHSLARLALQAFAKRESVDNPRLTFRHTTFNAHIENVAYHTAFFLHLFPRQPFGYDRNKPLIRTDEFDNSPLVTTEAAYITLGPAAIITCPGELLPENFVGGYDGSYAGKYRFIDYSQPNPADPTKAPKPPYLIDLMHGDPKHRMVYGLTLDFLGYIVPRYNFVLDPIAPYLQDAPGDHYEETNSIGPRAEPELAGTMRELVLSEKLDRGEPLPIPQPQ